MTLCIFFRDILGTLFVLNSVPFLAHIVNLDFLSIYFTLLPDLEWYDACMMQFCCPVRKNWCLVLISIENLVFLGLSLQVTAHILVLPHKVEYKLFSVIPYVMLYI
jgi:hypothetical protein